MTDGQAPEPNPGAPSRRALGAMESAVRRARETHGGPPPTEPPRSSSTPTRPPRRPEPVIRGPRVRPGRRRPPVRALADGVRRRGGRTRDGRRDRPRRLAQRRSPAGGARVLHGDDGCADPCGGGSVNHPPRGGGAAAAAGARRRPRRRARRRPWWPAVRPPSAPSARRAEAQARASWSRAPTSSAPTVRSWPPSTGRWRRRAARPRTAAPSPSPRRRARPLRR